MYTVDLSQPGWTVRLSCTGYSKGSSAG